MLKNILKRDKRSDVERKFDEKLEVELDNAGSIEDLNGIVSVMVKRNELRKKGVSADTKLVVAGNLIGIALILGYERGHVITTKAIGFVLRGRV